MVNKKNTFIGCFRVLLFFGCFELFLHLGGWFFLLTQNWENHLAGSMKDTVVILCLGESMTALGGDDAYPRQLENILNELSSNVKFKVINKGVPSTNSSKIVQLIDDYISQYQPDVVVTMMGTNDEVDPDNKKQQIATKKENIPFVLKLFESFFVKPKAESQYETPHDRIAKKMEQVVQAVDASPSYKDYVMLATIAGSSNQPETEEIAIRKALMFNPNGFEALMLLGMMYEHRGEFLKAVEALDAAIRNVPPVKEYQIKLYEEAAECAKNMQDDNKAINYYKKIIELEPQSKSAFGRLGEVYFERKNYDLAENLFREQLSYNSTVFWIYGRMAYCLRQRGNIFAAQKVIEKGMEMNPGNVTLLIDLANHFFVTNQYSEAIEVLKKALIAPPEQIDPVKTEVYGLLAYAYEKIGQSRLAKESRRKSLINIPQENMEVGFNYRRLYQELKEHRIPLIAVQYPLRDVNSLKEMLFEGHKGEMFLASRHEGDLIFVDNKSSFEKVVAQDGYDVYFTDRFAGDFGHCAAKGNRLLAHNIAQKIIKRLNIQQ